MRKPLVFGSVVALVAGLGAGTAFAYFTSTGSGSGSGSTGTLQAVTVAAVAGTPSSTLLPGGPAADVVLNVYNPNTFAVTLVSVTGNGLITADGGHAGCTTTGVTFSNQTNLSDTIAASDTTLVHLPGAASMSSSSLSACQGATFSIPVAITVHK
jgi:hypothetical protein